jgi:hypothetical protein
MVMPVARLPARSVRQRPTAASNHYLRPVAANLALVAVQVDVASRTVVLQRGRSRPITVGCQVRLEHFRA